MSNLEQLEYFRSEADKYYEASEAGFLTIKYHQGRGIAYRIGSKRDFAYHSFRMLNRELALRSNIIKKKYCE